MNIEHETAGNRFVTKMEGEEAFISYDMANGTTLNLLHTEVPPSFEGKGVASALARFAFDYAREKGYRVTPTCEFLSSWIQKHHEYDDIIER